MKTINKPGDNLGGLTKIWAIPKDVVSVNGMAVAISDDTYVYAIYCTPGSMSFKEPKDKTDAGIHYNTAITGFVLSDSNENREAIDYLERRKWCIIFKDGNGNYKLAGTRFQPLEAAADLDTGNDTQNLAGFTLSFSGKTLERAVFVNNPF